MKRSYHYHISKLIRTDFRISKKPISSIKWILLWVLCITGSFIAGAQNTYNGSAVLTSQAEVNLFGSQGGALGFNKITENLIIYNSTDITDLSPLSSLTSVGGLVIENNTALTNLNGLQNITTVGGFVGTLGLEIRINNNLTDISGLSGVLLVTDYVYIEQNPLLTSLNGLQLTNIGAALRISDNNNLANLNGLQNMVSAGSIELLRNPVLTDLSSLSGIQQIPSDVIITENLSLTTLNGLQFTSADRVIINGNNSLINLSGLQNLVSVTNILQIILNPQLTDLSALNTLTTADDIQINQNNSLQGINGFNNLSSTNHIEIDSNTLLNNFCGLRPWAIANPTSTAFDAEFNAYNPSLQQVITACDGATAGAMTAITGPIFEDYLIQSGIDTNTTPDGFVLTSAISNLTELKINSYDISDFTGLDDFTALAEFEMLNNQAVAIQPINFSGNTNLDKITIINSPNVPSVDISQNNALRDLSIVTRGTVFNSIDLTGKTNLLLLQLADNNISSIDLSPVPNLTFLGVAVNPITSLDVSGFADLEALDTYESQITSLDLSSNTKLTRIDGKDGALTSLNLKNGFNTNLNSVNLDGNAGLSCIQVDDVTFATQQTTASNWTKDASAQFSQNCNVQNTVDVAVSFEAYLEDSTNTFFDALGNQVFPSDGIVGNGKVLRDPIERIDALNIDETIVNANISSYVGIGNFTALTKFTLRASPAGLLSLELNSNTNLEEISITDTNIENLILPTNTNTLQKLTLSQNNLSGKTIDVSGNSSLEEIQGILSTFSALNTTSCGALRILNFDNGSISSFELSTNTNLESINLDSTPITDLELDSGSYPNLTSIIVTRSAVQNLTIRNTAIAYIALDQLSDLELVNIEENSLLQGVFLNNPGFEPTSITRLSLRANDLTGTLDISDLSNITTIDVSNNPNLTTLDITNQVNLEFLATYQSGITALDLSTNNGTLSEVTVGNTLGDSNLTSLNLNNTTSNLVYTNFILTTDRNPALNCIEVHNATDAQEAVNQGFWSVPSSQSFNTDCSATQPTTRIPDLNFRAKLIELGHDNNNPNDEYVLTSSIAAVTNLNIQGLDIEDLTGIEAFTSLVTLDAVANRLTVLNLSNSPNLENVALGSNQLSTLDFSSNPNLINLEAANNSLTNINISANPSLESIYLYDNLLTTLDTSSNTELKYLTLNGNNITAIDLSLNINMEELVISGTLTSLDLRLNAGLQDLFISQGSIEILDLRGLTFLDRFENGGATIACIQVNDVNAAESNSNWADGNYSLDCGQQTAYTSIPDDIFEAELERLGYGDGIDDNNRVLTASIAAVTELDLENMFINDLTGIEAFASLEVLNISGTNTTNFNLNDVPTLIELEANLTSMLNLNTSNNQNTTLHSLSIYGNSLSTIDLSNYNALESLNISENQGITALSLTNHPSFNTLEIEGTGIIDLELTKTALTNIDLNRVWQIKNALIYDNANLTSIQLSSVENPLLEVLQFRDNNLQNLNLSGFTEISSVHVGGNLNLTTLDITDLTGLELIDTAGSGITTIDLSTNNGFLVFAGFGHPEGDSNLTSLNLNNTNLDYTSFTLITENNPNLTCIEVHNVSEAENAASGIDWDVSSNQTFSTDCSVVQTKTTVPDDVFEAELERLGYGDGIADNNLVLTASIAVVKELDLEKMFINDLTGIEAFTSLEVLNITDTNTTIFDLTDVPSLIELNANLTSMITLNTATTQNGTLQKLSIYGNSLSSLDLTKYNALEYVDISENGGITALDLSNNPSLTFINGINSGLTELNLKNGNNTILNDVDITGTNLTCVAVDNTSLAEQKVTNGEWKVDTTVEFKTNCNSVSSYEAEVEIVTDILNTANINEGLRDIEIKVSIPNADTDNLLVDFDIQVIELTAIADNDFNSIPQNEKLVYEYFNDGLTAYTIGILDDTLLEGDEQFRIRISNPSDTRVTLKDADTNGNLDFVVTILDNESGIAVLSAVSGAEGGNARFTVNLQDGSGD
ncbi:MAG: hypothetical protein ABJF52_12650, partial [Aurantibacter sp.]